ncbi:MAG: hypothetical protein ACOZIN_03535 [Myxococcota bacterium]
MRGVSKALLGVTLWVAGCVGPEDNPTRVHDLRVLGVSVEPPELMAPSCADTSSQARAVYATPVRYTALLADPAGAGRDLFYELFACAWPGDRNCSSEADRVKLVEGIATAGELSLDIVPGALFLPDGKTPLLARVLELDTYKGLGGIRMPLVLRVRAGEEEIFAQKLMVFSCRFFADMKANVTPQVPGLSLDGMGWTDVVELSGAGPFELSPDAFADRQEAYVVPSYQLEPVHLVESWKLSWHATLGSLSPGTTGGSDFGGQESRHRVEWSPGSNAGEQEVTFWTVVRDGRGGTSWLVRRAHYRP